MQNQLQKSVAFLYTNNEQIEKKYRKIIRFTIASKIIPRNKLNKGYERSVQGKVSTIPLMKEIDGLVEST
jgi:hypothetical protein